MSRLARVMDEGGTECVVATTIENVSYLTGTESMRRSASDVHITHPDRARPPPRLSPSPSRSRAHDLPRHQHNRQPAGLVRRSRPPVRHRHRPLVRIFHDRRHAHHGCGERSPLVPSFVVTVTSAVFVRFFFTSWLIIINTRVGHQMSPRVGREAHRRRDPA